MENEAYQTSPAYIPEHSNTQTPGNHDLNSDGSLRRMSSGQDLDIGKHRRRRMRKRVQKLALKMLLEDESDEDSSVDDPSDDPQNDESTNVLASLAALLSKDDKANPTIKRENTERKKPRVVQYKAEFYYYDKPHPLDREYMPELLRTITKRKPISIERASKSTDIECFDLTSMYAVPASTDETDFGMMSKAVLAELGTYIKIRSRFLLDCLKQIVLYYPTVSFIDELVLEEPFCMLLHYRKELKERRNSAEKAASETDSADRDESLTRFEHLTFLIDYLEQRYADALSQELRRHQASPAMCTYEWVWLLFKPGSIVYSWTNGVLWAFVVEEHDRDARKKKDDQIRPRNLSRMYELESTQRRERLIVTVWFLAFNGKHLGRRREEFNIPMFDGEKSIISLPIFPHEFMKHDERVHKSLSTQEYLLQRGQLFFEMTHRSYKHYDGITADSPRRSIRGRVMVDTKYFLDSGEINYLKVGLSSNVRPQRDAEDEDGYYPPPPNDALGKGKNDDWKTRDIYAHYDGIIPEDCESLDSQQYIICPARLSAFVLKTRQIEALFVDKFSKPVFQVDLMKELVLDDDAKAMVKALSQRYTMQSEANDSWSADFVKNKGEGQIFLLHGKPGVGKTTTAECVAELTQRPLLSITSGDLGVDPKDVEERLNKWLQMAEVWGAVLLLDEADVYLESRINQDLRRNTLVSIFLRALEYYQGLLFLTTNRVGTFDDAFVSRIHVAIHYPDFTNEKRCQIWDIFFNKLEREKENIKFTQRTVDYAKESKEIQSLKWNGREIRNAFSTAVALAEFENERDDKRRVIFHARHLEQVVKMSKAFQDYLKSTHGMSLEEQARRYRTRNDYWEGPGEGSGS
ncbi:MAG: hypothetical protein Q9195_002345 [Heterodermia aff. obscurata]